MEEYNSQEEKDAAQKAFEKYKKEQEEAGRPIDHRAVAAGEREMEAGRRGNYPVYGEEASREKLIASYPKGRSQEEEKSSETEESPDVSKIGLDKEKIKEEIAELTKARQTIVSFMEQSDMEDLHKLTLLDLKEELFDLPDNVVKAADFLSEKDFDDTTKIWELPEEIKNAMDEDILILKNLEK
jgi:hypothetical protein